MVHSRGIAATSAVIAAVALGACGGSPSERSPRAHAADPSDHYGGIPKWLPQAKVPSHRVESASLAHPRLATQGDQVDANFDGGHVLVTAVGPRVPAEGQNPVPETSPTKFVVTFSGASRRIPLKAEAFRLVDERHHVHTARMTAMNGASAPAFVEPGQNVSVQLDAVLPTGDGGLEWAPSGPRPVVGWDFIVEID